MAAPPLWVFDSLLLREALAKVNLAAVPAIVRAASGLSQRDLSGVVGWNPATLSYYERGQRDGMFDIRTVLQFADAVGMPPGALLPLVFADPTVQLASTGYELSEKLSRVNPGSLTTAASPPVSIPQAVIGSHVKYWQACTNVLYTRDRAIGGTALLPSALQQWRRVAPSIQANVGEPHPQLLAAAGELALCTGWVALDADCLAIAVALYEKARELAVSAGDVLLAVHVLTSQSMLHAEMAKAGSSRESVRQALQLAYQAADEGRYVPIPPLHVLIALRHASAASLVGDEAAFQAAIGQARRELNRGPRDSDPPQRLRFVSETEIIETEADGYLTLGDAARSATLYRRALACELSPRDRASCGAGLGDALLRQGATQEAVATAMEVLSAFEGGVTSMRSLNRLRLIRRAADNTGWAQRFRERFDAAEQTLAATCALPRGDAPLTSESLGTGDEVLTMR